MVRHRMQSSSQSRLLGTASSLLTAPQAGACKRWRRASRSLGGRCGLADVKMRYATAASVASVMSAFRSAGPKQVSFFDRSCKGKQFRAPEEIRQLFARLCLYGFLS